VKTNSRTHWLYPVVDSQHKTTLAYLGVIISNTLTWSCHVAFVTKKPAILWTSYTETWNIVQGQEKKWNTWAEYAQH